jgi:RHS repeat-associated protein
LRYAGYAFDAHSGLYYCSQRYYDPMTMQWMTKDPARADGEESAYQYCGGDPVGRVDPSGLWSGYAHRVRTRSIALRLNYPGWLAEAIGDADVGVDTGPQHWSGKQLSDNWRWHMSRSFGELRVNEAIRSGSWFALGEGLHVIQDYQTHRYLKFVAGLIWRPTHYDLWSSPPSGLSKGQIEAAKSGFTSDTERALMRFRWRWSSSFSTWTKWHNRGLM